MKGEESTCSGNGGVGRSGQRRRHGDDEKDDAGLMMMMVMMEFEV